MLRPIQQYWCELKRRQRILCRRRSLRARHYRARRSLWAKGAIAPGAALSQI